MTVKPKDMQDHMAQYTDENYVDGWAALWDKGGDLPSDEGFPNPALEDTLVQQQMTLGLPIVNVNRCKALVPGCGRGVDVLLLASFGYDAYGLEYSATAIEACKKEEAENYSWYQVRDQAVGRGKVTFVQGDFFDDAWLQEIGVSRNGFDLVYDYTVPLRHTQLLAPSPLGNLICLEFPRPKDPKAAGPPYASPSEAYMEHLSHPGEEIPYDDKGFVNQHTLTPSKAGFESVAHWQPERTLPRGQYENGMIHDRVSIWHRRY
ncbi:hypothetical protein N7495_003640 [Penicillium taxi]|uniref:uncharacterized protein n=1 Tax=Penicillium taxi TaxID=168475 RepID=UPI002545A923|nr:uncharacterized protein N7495_003640 [Penicillium taxi]KAJ5898896.1 hypothetical protein N7495_003640 [Penicillium taxi]